jgi:Tol biopolymer transport system component
MGTVCRTIDRIEGRPRGLIIAVSAVAIIVVALWGVQVWLSRHPQPHVYEKLRAVPLTTYVGNQDWPSFSPDGNEVAFSWDGEKEDNYDIYRKRIGPDPPQRLTHAPAADTNPAWSPDGRSIAFLRTSAAGKLGVVVMPSTGGPERIVGEVARVELLNRCLAWSPDGRWLVVFDRPPSHRAGLWLLSPESGERRRLTTATAEHAPLEKSAVFDSSGRWLAFARNVARNSFDLYVLPLSKDFSSAGEPRLVARTNRHVGGIAWAVDGRELLFSAGHPGNIHLFRMSVSDGAMQTVLSEPGEVLGLSVSRRANRLVFVHSRREMDIHRAELAPEGAPARRSVPLIVSSRLDRFPSYSPDGKRVAFVSLRSGEWQLWLTDQNGRGVRQMTSFEGAEVAFPDWSPDGRNIAFVSNAEGPWEAYVINSGGGKPHKLLSAGKQLYALTWSRNGQWLYFLSGQGGSRQIWRMPSAGGEPQQLTQRGAFGEVGVQSPDGKRLYYLGPAGIWTISAEGADEREVARWDINPSPLEADSRGIYFVDSKSTSMGAGNLMFFRFPQGPVMPVGVKTGYGFSVSPDGRHLLYTTTRSGADLMLVNNLR